jgi:putative ABC transport system ATP-binding protein
VSAAPALLLADLTIAFQGRSVLQGAEAGLAGGAMAALTGPSGSGKTSLIHALAGIERPAGGRIAWGPVAPWALGEAARDAWRRTTLGLVFQEFHLIEGLSALENALLPWRFDHARLPAGAAAAAAALLGRLGVPAGAQAVGRLSRGERQRVAIARALARAPAVLLADEPTASLDAESGAAVADLLLAEAAARGMTLLVATHDASLLAHLPGRWHLESGRLEVRA